MSDSATAARPPAGNGQVGDKLLLRFALPLPDGQKTKAGQNFIKGPWRTGVLLANDIVVNPQHQCRGKVRLDDTGEELVVRHCQSYFCEPDSSPQVYILPGNLQEEFPTLYRRFYDEQGAARFGILIIRDTGNRATNLYAMLCDRCKCRIEMRMESVESAGLTLEAPGRDIDDGEVLVWESGKPGIEDGGRSLACECGRDWSDLDEAEEILENVEDYI